MCDFEENDDVLPNWIFEETSEQKNRKKLKDPNILEITDKVTVKRVYALGRTISKIFKDAGLTYWSSGGTTLGIIRHGGLIPWDDDIDLCILEKVNKDSSKFLVNQIYLSRMRICLKV